MNAIGSTEGTVIEEVVDTVENFVGDLFGEEDAPSSDGVPSEAEQTPVEESIDQPVDQPIDEEPVVDEPIDTPIEQPVEQNQESGIMNQELEETTPIDAPIDIPIDEPLLPSDEDEEQAIILPEEIILPTETINE